MAPSQPQPVSDPRVLRAIAHPVRIRILDELSASGPFRAADIAGRLDVPANQASFHLRQLAKYGLVVEAPEEARDGRDRVWRATSEAGLRVDLEQLGQVEGGQAAVAVFRKQWTGTAHDAVDRAQHATRQKDAMVMVSDSALRLTKAEAKKFAEELNDLVEKWRTREREETAGTKTYQVLQIVQPARGL
jgi:predicted ArsR family transcriptional regulator